MKKTKTKNKNKKKEKAKEKITSLFGLTRATKTFGILKEKKKKYHYA